MDSKGQAFFEFILFLPLMVITYFIVNGLGNSINGSINQQKFTRSYYFSKIKSNSFVPRPDYESYPGSGYPGWNKFGISMIGFRVNEFSGTSDQPETACYKIPLNGSFEDSDECTSYSDTRAKHIRVYTVFGICGATIQANSNEFFYTHQNFGTDSCLIQ
jgi:hypothetical protein